VIPDPLSDVLRVTRLSGGLFLRLRLGWPFGFAATSAETLRQALSPQADQLIPFHLVTKGPIWVHIEGAESVELNTNDILVLPHGTSHGLSDATGRKLVAVPDFLSEVQRGPLALTWPGSGTGEESRLLCGFFACRSRIYSPLLDALPNVMVVRHDPKRTPWLIATLERALDETLENRPGGNALVEQLTTLLFMELVQRQLEEHPNGWLRALSDPILSKVLQLIHEEPAHSWTLETLAKRAGSSRTVMAERFVDAIGISPIKYLATWRLELAAARLLDSDDSIAEIAADIGYDSAASFNRAFKRHVGAPPATWRKSMRAGRRSTVVAAP
jgi:AraC-like DNA-binding protein